ncbi:contact-dependent growth inhibition system immunity protein [Type-D symbiont of Plautia stali]|uniref:contact-dependent growth inhibition system immunity protein n=1 Tax=Type-D symbiont of Plautia stali TaxID=1560356 RepID=UPI00073F2304|nr:contact-dependent growth inhibition system immunity protein [Type-D symbiont of Plautia stali]
MHRSDFNELSCFITIYFGQDYDLIHDTVQVEPKIRTFLEQEHRASWYGLVADIELFLSKSDAPGTLFNHYFRDEFAPELWGTTAEDFLHLVLRMVNDAIKEYEDNQGQS